jgi:tRNA 2-thiouridine synthesizing protein A
MRAAASQSRIVTIVDARGRHCPVPLAMAKVRLEELAVGESLTLLATDPEAPLDVGAWAADAGHGYECVEREDMVEITLTRRT